MRVQSELKQKFGIAAAEILFRGVSVRRSGSEFAEFRSKRLEEARRKYSLETLKDDPLVRAYRDFYWSIGIDPTKQRPAAEALLRRVLAGKDLPSINSFVDCYNLASALTLVPMGAYDLAKIKGELKLRYSKGENFTGIGGISYTTSNEIAVADEEKIICIYPYRDSEATKVTETAKDVLVILGGVRGVSMEHLRSAAEETIAIVTRFCGGEGVIAAQS